VSPDLKTADAHLAYVITVYVRAADYALAVQARRAVAPAPTAI